MSCKLYILEAGCIWSSSALRRTRWAPNTHSETAAMTAVQLLPNWERLDLFLTWGKNPVVKNKSLCQHSSCSDLRQCKWVAITSPRTVRDLQARQFYRAINHSKSSPFQHTLLECTEYNVLRWCIHCELNALRCISGTGAKRLIPALAPLHRQLAPVTTKVHNLGWLLWKLAKDQTQAESWPVAT